MITIESKTQCCGCTACVERCPKKCISLTEDNEGFVYPIVDLDSCINCGICENVCPVINTPCRREPENSYSAFNPNDSERILSSSGGVFIALAKRVLYKGGVVFGAIFNPDNTGVIHAHAEDIEGVKAMMGSKYLQSDINTAYIHCEKFLKKDRLVLFTGSPCQIAGLKSFLRKDYPNLITVDFICHGVPSPGVWRKYLAENRINRNKCNPTEEEDTIISFRDKSQGWHNFGFSVSYVSTKPTLTTNSDNNHISLFTPHRENEYMRAFLNDLCLRPICYECPFKDGKSGSDITLADFWGIENILPEIDDNKGISLVIVKSQKVLEILKETEIRMDAIELDDALRFNPAYKVSAPLPKRRALFFKTLNKGKSISAANNKCLSQPISVKFKTKISNIVYKLFH